ncbi:conserved hypothetical protein [Ricinus communis]|uniref:Uncharacterized protein n=1 Tax=Ricinus communis TaxID=3988 RepID=B9THT1_RICCO|nr:conserved hypothetical protein [Ricinus communis]
MIPPIRKPLRTKKISTPMNAPDFITCKEDGWGSNNKLWPSSTDKMAAARTKSSQGFLASIIAALTSIQRDGQEPGPLPPEMPGRRPLANDSVQHGKCLASKCIGIIATGQGLNVQEPSTAVHIETRQIEHRQGLVPGCQIWHGARDAHGFVK